MNYNIVYFGQAYGAGTYNSSTYQGSTSTTTGNGTGTTGTTTGTTGTTAAVSPSKGVLTDTGFDIAAAATLACVIIFAALLTRFWRKPVPVPQEQERN